MGNKIEKQKVKISVFSEDGASVYEVRDENGKLVDRCYIGETTWIYNHEQAVREQKEFKDKINTQYEVIR